MVFGTQLAVFSECQSPSLYLHPYPSPEGSSLGAAWAGVVGAPFGRSSSRAEWGAVEKMQAFRVSGLPWLAVSLGKSFLGQASWGIRMLTVSVALGPWRS